MSAFILWASLALVDPASGGAAPSPFENHPETSPELAGRAAGFPAGLPPQDLEKLRALARLRAERARLEELLRRMRSGAAAPPEEAGGGTPALSDLRAALEEAEERLEDLRGRHALRMAELAEARRAAPPPAAAPPPVPQAPAPLPETSLPRIVDPLRVGNALYALGRFAEARRAYEEAGARGSPASPFVRYRVARCLEAEGDPAAAEAMYLRFLREHPESPWAREARIALGLLAARNGEAP